MASNNRILIGHGILGLAILIFYVALLFGSFYYGAIGLLIGLCAWFIIFFNGQTENLAAMSTTVMSVFAIVTGLGTFIGLGVRPDIFGGSELKAEGIALALLVGLLFLILGLIFRMIVNLEKKIEFLRSEMIKFYKLNTPGE